MEAQEREDRVRRIFSELRRPIINKDTKRTYESLANILFIDGGITEGDIKDILNALYLTAINDYLEQKEKNNGPSIT